MYKLMLIFSFLHFNVLIYSNQRMDDGMKEYEKEQILIDLEELKGTINIMVLGLNDIKDEDAVACMSILRYRLEQIMDKLKT